MATILITGINGFLGSNLAKAMASGHTVIGLAHTKQNSDRVAGLNIKMYSFADDDIETIFQQQQIDVVIHSATVYRAYEDKVTNLIDTNITLPVKLYELSNTYKAKAFMNVDSFFNDPKSSYTYLADYTLSKKHVLDWLKVMAKYTTVINMKLFHMFGPGDSPDKFVSQVLKTIVSNQTELKLTPGEQLRDFIYITDVVSAFEKVIEQIEIDSITDSFIEYEVGTGKSVSVKYFVEAIKAAAASNTELLFGALAYRENEIMASEANIKALLAIGWKPEVGLKDALDMLINDTVNKHI